MIPISGIKRGILQFLQSFFGTGRLVNPVDSTIKFKYDPDIEKTELLIMDKNVINSSEIGRLPMIILDRGVIQPMKLGIKQRAAYDPTSGTTTYADLFRMPLVLHCISANDEEAEDLAYYTAMAFWVHRDKFNPDGHHKFEFDAIGAPSIIIHEQEGETTSVFDVPVHATSHVHIEFGVGRDGSIFEGIYEGPVVKQLETISED